MPWSRRQRETGEHRLSLLTGDPAEGVLLGLCASLILISALRAADITDRLWLAACLAAGLSLPIGRLVAVARNSSSRPRPNARKILGAAFCIVGALIVMSTPDTSWDSMAYHFPAVLSIASGWNPLRGPTENWKVNLYPNGAWTLFAAAGTLLGSLDAGRILKLVMLGSAAWLVWRLLSRWIERPHRRFLLTVALIANPVVTAQLWTFYLDDLIYLLALCTFCLCLEFLRNPLARTIAPLCAAVILLSLTKLYGAYYASAAILAGMVCVGPARLSTARIAVPALVVTLAAIVLIGWRPFVTGWIDGGLLGAASYREAPPNLHQVARPLAFPVSMASNTGGTRTDPAQLKLPFSITPREIYFMAVPDPRAGGFGPFYSGTCLLALIMWAGLISSSAGNAGYKRAVLAAGVSVSTIVLAACLFFPMNWWARFVPIGWVLPLVPPVIAETLGLAKRVWWNRLSLVLIVLCLANSGLALGNAARTLHGWWSISGQLQSITKDAKGIGLTPDSDGGMHHTFIYWLELAGYNPRLLERGACRSADFSFRGIRFCALH